MFSVNSKHRAARRIAAAKTTPPHNYDNVNRLTATVAMGTAMKHPVPDRVKPVICNF